MSGGAVTRHKNILSQPLYNWLWQISQQIVYMRSSFHVPVFFYQYAFFINDECGALDAHVFFPVHALFFHDAVQIAHRFLFIGKEREIKFILVAEVAVLFHAVAAHAKYRIREISCPPSDGSVNRGAFLPTVRAAMMTSLKKYIFFHYSMGETGCKTEKKP